ncbi:uncharacterized protein N7498_004927 [Penicillium cinerascens]|uniref:S-adenosyl-L-methionine-dependent methyltransferase n=1 Tax=Penicillium cinerascens TaxID=70096 RepID=A0A9W9SZM2_9EURO|nr:uncharacterized protein N7498_004927 [Penicillium cinerascens]KAJ5204048.1 hypothetical protein N7498_004927 [Penicillium cinerascens]
MPRIPVSVLVKAYRRNPLLPLLLKECRSLDSARNELRWLRERALRDSRLPGRLRGSWPGWRARLRSMCLWRSRGFPLQYILGDQPFGDLEILCRRGVLIPRPETESYTVEAARLIRQALAQEEPGSPGTRSLRVLDLCTGTGCIALLLHALLASHFKDMIVLGVDLSPIALNLAQKNLDHNVDKGLLSRRASTDIHFQRADVLGRSDSSIPAVEEVLPKYFSQSGALSEPSATRCDLLISNPPYISASEFRDGTTARSVRLFEPRLALVPPATGSTEDAQDRPEDIFYRRILTLSIKLQAKVTVLECGDMTQAGRVVEMYTAMTSSHSDHSSAEIWPSTERDLAANGFHPYDGSRCVIIKRWAR